MNKGPTLGCAEFVFSPSSSSSSLSRRENNVGRAPRENSNDAYSRVLPTLDVRVWGEAQSAKLY